VSRIDPLDDSQRRWVIHHYRFDSSRRQRRNIAVAAYDNKAEFLSAIEELHEQVSAEIASGRRDAKEHVSGVVRPPGYQAEQARGRLVSAAVERGLDPRPLLEGGSLPPNVVLFGVDADGRPWQRGGGDSPRPTSRPADGNPRE
jgi:hypothetical protein